MTYDAVSDLVYNTEVCSGVFTEPRGYSRLGQEYFLVSFLIFHQYQTIKIRVSYLNHILSLMTINVDGFLALSNGKSAIVQPVSHSALKINLLFFYMAITGCHIHTCRVLIKSS